MAEINLPYNSTGRVAYRSNLDSSIVNEIFRKSDENDRYIMKLINAIMGKNAQWSAVITYNKYDIVGTGKDIYMSKRDSNLNKVVTNADWWEKIDVGSLDVSDQLTKYALKEELPEWVVSETEPTSKDKIWIKPTASNELTELVETLKRLLAPELQTLPIGAYINYPTQRVIPAGFLIADGRSLKKSEYPELFNVLGYVYGGSGENFNLPNFSDGKFMRSIGGNAASLGVVQQDAFQGHFHKWKDSTTEAGWAYNLTGNTSNKPGTRDNISSIAEPKTDGVNGEPRTANETRPLNMSVVVLIKAKDVISPSAGQIDKTIVATEAKAGVVKLKNSITAQQEDAAVTEKAVSDLFSQIDLKCVARVTFSGQGSIKIVDSKNISTITKNGAGDYTLNFITPMKDTNYYILTSLEPFNTAGPNHVAHPQYLGIKTDSLRIITGYGSTQFSDELRVQVLIFSAN